MKIKTILNSLKYTPWVIIYNILQVYLCYMVCRIAFVLENLSTLGHIGPESVSLIITAILTVAGMRGYFFYKSTRPLAMVNAHAYVDNPLQSPIVVNNPFALLRTMGTECTDIPDFFDNQFEMETVEYEDDLMAENNLVDRPPISADSLATIDQEMKAFLQSLHTRMNNDDMRIKQ